MLKMLTDYMEGGFLENIISLFRKDDSLYTLIGEMLADERGRVRLGTIALVETLMSENHDKVLTAIPGIGDHLKNPNPTIRGDAAYLLGIICHTDALPYLKEAEKDDHETVREAVRESIDIISEGSELRF
jgi:HEAT repeat protein